MRSINSVSGSLKGLEDNAAIAYLRKRATTEFRQKTLDELEARLLHRGASLRTETPDRKGIFLGRNERNVLRVVFSGDIGDEKKAREANVFGLPMPRYGTAILALRIEGVNMLLTTLPKGVAFSNLGVYAENLSLRSESQYRSDIWSTVAVMLLHAAK